MGVVGGPDPIVTDGLVYTIDPASIRSYISGSGTVTDVIGNESNTITSGVQVVANPGTAWRWPSGVTNYIDCGDNDTVRPLTGEVSYNWWMYSSDNSGYRAPLACWHSSDGTKHHIWFGLYPGGHVIHFWWNGSDRFTDTVDANTWVNICVTWDGTTLTGYTNGSSFATSTPGIKSDADNLSYGYDLNRALYSFKGDLGPLYIYHKELTAAEVLQNYNALKDRFV